MQPSAPKQLVPTHATTSLFDGVEWRTVSVQQKLTGSAGYGDNQDLPVDLKFTNNFLSFKGSTVAFDLHITGSSFDTVGSVAGDLQQFDVCAPMMFRSVEFDTGDSSLNIKDSRYAYLLNYMKLTSDHRDSTTHAYHGNAMTCKTVSATECVLSIVMPVSVLVPFMEMERYYHGKQSRLTLTTDDLQRCVEPVTQGDVDSIVIKNFSFNYKKLEIPPATRNSMLAAMGANPYPFMFDNYKVDTRAIDGDSSYQVTNDRTYTQHVGIVCYGVNDAGSVDFDYYDPLPLTLTPVNVNLRIGGGLTNETCITDNLTHMAVIAESYDIVDYVAGVNDALIDGVLRQYSQGGVFLWQTGLEQSMQDTCATGMALPTRNNFIDIDLKVSTPSGSLTSAQVANVIFSQEKLIQNGSTSMFVK